MKKMRILAILVLLTASMAVAADDGQVVVVNGSNVGKSVTKMVFEGDNVVLTYRDNTIQTVDMANVVIVFSVADAVKALTNESGNASVSYFDLNGCQLKQAPPKGAYMVKKGDTVVKILKK